MGPSVLQQINKATGYTPNLGIGGSSNGQVYQGAAANAPAKTAAAPPPASSAPGPDYSAIIASNNALIAAEQAQTQAQYTPYFNTYQNYLNAQGQATAATNPLYTAKLNTYLAQEATNKARKQADTTTALGQIQQGLGDTLAKSATTAARTAQDTQTNVDQINNNEQQYQQDQGNAFDSARLALLKGSSDTGSGLGAQAEGAQQTARNTTEGRQVQSFDTQKAAQDLFKNRTIEDLNTGNAIAQRNAGQQTTATNLDLSRYIEDLQSAEAQTRNDLEAQRLQDIAASTQNYERLGVQKFLSTLSGQQEANAAKAYL